MGNFNFADRYRAAGLSPTSEIVSSRQGAFEALRKGLDAGKTIDLTRLYFQLPEKSGTPWFREGFAEADKGFTMVENQREAAVLASCLLSAALEDGRLEAGLAPLAASAAGNRLPDVYPDLLAEAKQELTLQAVRGRHGTIPDAQIKLSTGGGMTASIEQFVAGPDWPKTADLFKLVGAQLSEALKSVATQFESAIAARDGVVEELREEADILWWYVGSWSRALERPFSDLQPGLIAVLAGLELGQLKRTKAGPASAPAILHKLILSTAGQRPDRVTIQEAVDALPGESFERLSLDQNALSKVPDICPVLTAFAKASESGPSPSWHGAYKKASGFEPATNFGVLDLAVQAYREVVLLDMLG